MKNWVDLSCCVVGHIYELHSRNLQLGVYTGRDTFLGIRTKFTQQFLDEELHYDKGGTARPISEIGKVPSDLVLLESLGTYDEKTGEMVEFDKPIIEGGKGWYFLNTGISSKDIIPRSKLNTKLFEFLQNVKVNAERRDCARYGALCEDQE